MRDDKPVEFVRKCNDDWTIHSYCSRCFSTVADGMNVEVTAAEYEHVCDPRLLKMVEEYRSITHLAA
jgi:hypothetical protein